MRVLTGLRALKHPPRRSVVTVGMFDGVHIAHQHLILAAVRAATRVRGTSVVITFDPDPQQVLDPHHAQFPLMPLEERVRLIETLGVDLLWIIPFTRAFSKTTPAQFVRAVLFQRLRASCVVVGETFAFGRARRGNLQVLEALGQQYEMRVLALAPVLRGGKPVSSSRIRQLVQMGALHQARLLLGRPIQLTGTVVHGRGQARQLGFPTANVRLANTLLPPRGVYRIQLHAAGKRFQGLMNLGVRPTFGRGPLTCEVHLVGFHGNLYGQSVTVTLFARLRDERRFANPQALIQQIQRDLTRASLLLPQHV